jgi:hypothetical protein
LLFSSLNAGELGPDHVSRFRADPNQPFKMIGNGLELVECLDDEGIEVSDLEDAKAQALSAMDELRQEYADVIQDWSGWRLDIVDPEGRILHSFQLIETLH